MLPSDEISVQLRKMINETIPEDGNESNTNFTDKELNSLLAGATNVYMAASFAWTIKAGLLNERVEKYKVGQESYDKTTLKDMADHALKMAKQYAELGKNEEIPSAVQSGFIFKVKPPEVL